MDKVSQHELMHKGQQIPVVELAEKALANQAWNALATEERRAYSEVAGRINWGQTARKTRHYSSSSCCTVLDFQSGTNVEHSPSRGEN